MENPLRWRSIDGARVHLADTKRRRRFERFSIWSIAFTKFASAAAASPVASMAA
jgi:hypothetical protein